MKRGTKLSFEAAINWFECDDYEQLKGKIKNQKAVWAHEDELKANIKTQKKAGGKK